MSVSHHLGFRGCAAKIAYRTSAFLSFIQQLLAKKAHAGGVSFLWLWSQVEGPVPFRRAALAC